MPNEIYESLCFNRVTIQPVQVDEIVDLRERVAASVIVVKRDCVDRVQTRLEEAGDEQQVASNVRTHEQRLVEVWIVVSLQQLPEVHEFLTELFGWNRTKASPFIPYIWFVS